MTPSLGFNKPESANFTSDCVLYLMPKESISNFSSCAQCAYCFVLHALYCTAPLATENKRDTEKENTMTHDVQTLISNKQRQEISGNMSLPNTETTRALKSLIVY